MGSGSSAWKGSSPIGSTTIGPVGEECGDALAAAGFRMGIVYLRGGGWQPLWTSAAATPVCLRRLRHMPLALRFAVLPGELGSPSQASSAQSARVHRVAPA
jgi:hypothetical protein